MPELPVIDLHTHVLPKMDDGSKSSEMSLAMLHAMHTQGTDIAVATPHYYARHESIERFLDRRGHSLDHLSEVLSDDCPQVLTGAEVAFFFGIEEAPELDKLCIGQSRALLLEMPFAAWGDYELHAVSSLCLDRGFQVVLAHFERFVPFQKGSDMAERILALPVFVQINAETLLPMLSRGPWLKMFEQGRAQLLGSDAHNLTNRAPNMGKARDIIKKKLGPAALQRIDTYASKLIFGVQGNDYE